VTAARVRMVGVPPPQNRGGFGAGRGPGFQQRPGAGPAIEQGRPGAEAPSMQQGRPGMGAGPSMQQRPGAGSATQPGRPGGVTPQAPSNQPPADNRSWADRAHALGQPSLPPGQQPRNEPPPQREPQMREPQMREGGDANPSQGRFVPNGSPREFNNSPGAGRSFRDDRPPTVNQPERVEPPPAARPPVNNFSRPQMDRAPPPFENHGIEERRPAESPRFANPPSAPVPNNRFASPPPAPVPSNRGFAPPPPAPSAPVTQPRMAPPPQQPRMAPPPPPPQQRQQAPAQQERGPQQRPGQRGGDPRRN